jgi:hypothetical protein
MKRRCTEKPTALSSNDIQGSTEIFQRGSSFLRLNNHLTKSTDGNVIFEALEANLVVRSRVTQLIAQMILVH